MIGKRLQTLVLSAAALFCRPRNLHTCYTYLSFNFCLCVYLIFRRRWPKRSDIFTAHILNTKNPRHVQNNNNKNRMVMTTQSIESWHKHMGNKRKNICSYIYFFFYSPYVCVITVIKKEYIQKETCSFISIMTKTTPHPTHPQQFLFKRLNKSTNIPEPAKITNVRKSEFAHLCIYKT